QPLHHLRSFANATVVQDNLLRQLWLQQVLSNVRDILAMQSELTLEKLAELTKIFKVALSTPLIPVSAMQHDIGIESVIFDTIVNLQEQTDKLSLFYVFHVVA
ncbi:hypothetical protein J6590_098501, partial [Homalodisca vitripennis]